MVLQWQAHPLRTRPGDAALAFALMALAAWAVLVGLHSAYLAVGAVALLFAATADYWLPTAYQATATELCARRWGRVRTLRWCDVRRVAAAGNVCVVSPLPRAHWLDRYRGVWVLLDGAPPGCVARLQALAQAGQVAVPGTAPMTHATPTQPADPVTQLPRTAHAAQALHVTSTEHAVAPLPAPALAPGSGAETP